MRKPTGALVAIMTATSLALVAVVLVMLNAMFPFLRFTGGIDPAPKPVKQDTTPKVTDVVAKGSPAEAFVKSMMDSLPAKVGSLSQSAVGPDRSSSMPTGTCDSVVPSSVSATRAWSGGSWMHPVGATATVFVYPAGMGASAMQKQIDCGAVGDTDSVTASDDSSWYKAIRHGDIVLFVSSNQSGIRDSILSAMESGTAKFATSCVNLSSPAGEDTRNPYSAGDKFTGKIVSKPVKMSVPPAKKYAFPAPYVFESVDLPSKPAFPYWPLDLPKEPAKPSFPVTVQYPGDEASINIRVPDVEGPGCGWAFTGLKAPAFNAAKINAENSATEKAKVAQLDKAMTGYPKAIEDWKKSYATYQSGVSEWKSYVAKVKDTAEKWGEQKAAQQRYADRMAVYNQAVQDRDNFLEEQRNAKDTFDSETNYCNTFDYTPQSVPTTIYPKPVPSQSSVVVTPPPVTIQPTAPAVPSGSPSVAPPAPVVSQPAPTTVPTTVWVTPEPIPTTVQVTPEPTISCPRARPAILDQAPPSVPTKPTPPADPRPESER